MESGNVRGFVNEEDLIRGEDAEQIMDYLEKQADRISAMLPEGLGKEAYFFTATDTVPYYENDAYVFRRITTRDTVIDPEAALAGTEIDILEERSDDARVTGVLKEGGLAFRHSSCFCVIVSLEPHQAYAAGRRPCVNLRRMLSRPVN